LLGLVLGGIASNVGSLLTSPQARDLITRLGGLHGLTDAFIAAELGFAGVLASAYGIQAAGRLRSEEVAGHLEPLLATATGRAAWACSHLVIALLGTAALLAAAGLGAGVVRMAETGDGAAVGRLLGSALAQVPATWVLAGIVVATFGLFPKLAGAGWIPLVAFVLIGEFGPALRLAQPVLDLSPFAHVPKLPGGEFAPAPLVWLTLLAAGLALTGLIAFQRRDLG
jgi:ABC-2 type transport system permease protein